MHRDCNSKETRHIAMPCRRSGHDNKQYTTTRKTQYVAIEKRTNKKKDPKKTNRRE